MIDFIQLAWNLFNQSSDRIIWNIGLALIPLALSYYLFRPSIPRDLVWWLLLLVFVAFLPNAPYILTDSIHIIELSQQNYPLSAIILVLIPQYTLFIVAGFQAYVLALVKLENYLKATPVQKHLTLIKAIVHSLSVVGIYLGRFERFNSWDLVTQPIAVILTTVQDLFNFWHILVLSIGFVLIWLLTELIKLVNKTLAINLDTASNT